ncbi:hypothetical protein A3Q56_01037 [Intoshia linei]|uniref:Sushi domain-containing protein n=1 Tax=Intoshia linei TaxID=1819745 RepID=A0A177BA11_9BILA|nr:hypothetical protein A3Q56_01037 [Intoshia linei]
MINYNTTYVNATIHRSIGTYLKIECRKGYQSHYNNDIIVYCGEQVLVCQYGKIPVLKGQVVIYESSINNEVNDENIYKPGNYLIFACINNTRTKLGSTRIIITCITGGLWDATATECFAMAYPPFDLKGAWNKSTDLVLENTEISLYCRDGYILYRDETVSTEKIIHVVCLKGILEYANKYDILSCKPILCDTKTLYVWLVNVNMDIITGIYYYDEKIPISCNRNYRLNTKIAYTDDAMIYKKCDISGNIAVKDLKCYKTTCNRIELHRYLLDKMDIYSKIMLTCPLGYGFYKNYRSITIKCAPVKNIISWFDITCNKSLVNLKNFDCSVIKCLLIPF